MFNKYEWKKIFKGIETGIGVGIVIDIVLVIWVVCGGFVNLFYDCFCFGGEEKLVPGTEVPDITLLYIVIISAIIGLIIGIFSAISSRNDRRTKEKDEKKADNHNNILRMAKSVWQRAEIVVKSINSQTDTVCYYKENKQKDINNIFEQIENQQKILFEDLEKYKVD